MYSVYCILENGQVVGPVSRHDTIMEASMKADAFKAMAGLDHFVVHMVYTTERKGKTK